jgi:predicted Zn-dependent protease
MRLPTHHILRIAACLSALLFATACSSSDSRASAALGEYQAAAASNNLFAARQALLKLVQAKEDVSDYWAELGKVQAQMGAYGDAYYAFTRAYELDRSNPALLQSLTILGLRSGDVGLAQKYARELEIVSPGDPWVKLTDGWAAFSEKRYDDAVTASDSILANAPYDPSAKVLKARALLGLEQGDEAIKLLSDQVRAQPSDSGSLDLLAKIYASQNDWPRVVDISRRLAVLNPADRSNALVLIDASFRSGQIGVARNVSLRMLRGNASPQVVSAVLDLWASDWPSPQRIEDARALADAASGREQKLTYAAFLSRVGSPADGARIAAPFASLPVTAESAEANAVLGDALRRSGNLPGAKARFDAVIAFDPGNATALRGRSELEIRTGNWGAAIADAQKLVTVLPNSSSDRLLLARAYSGSGNRAAAERTLWTAFQDIPADEQIFTALKVNRSGNAEAVNQLQAEFARQQNEKLNRGLL